MKRSKHLEAHGIIALKPSHPRIKQLSQHRQKTRIHGHKIWDSSYVLMDFLLDEPIRKRARMMELGCGWGLLSVFLAHYFEYILPQFHCILLTLYIHLIYKY